MAAGGRAQTRDRLLRRAALIAAVLIVLALLFLLSGHWILAIIVGAPGLAAAWAFVQARSVR